MSFYRDSPRNDPSERRRGTIDTGGEEYLLDFLFRILKGAIKDFAICQVLIDTVAMATWHLAKLLAKRRNGKVTLSPRRF